MGSGGTGGGGGTGSAGGGWGTTMGSGGNAYSGGKLGGLGTAGTMSGGAGGSAMGGFGNTAAGGSGMAGVSTQSGMTPAGFTPAYGDPRGLSLGMNATGGYANPEAGKIGLRSDGTVVRGYVQVRNPRTNQLEYRTIIQNVTPSKTNPGYGYTQSGNLVQMKTAAPAPGTSTGPIGGGVLGPGGTLGMPSPFGSGPNLGQMGPGPVGSLGNLVSRTGPTGMPGQTGKGSPTTGAGGYGPTAGRSGPSMGGQAPAGSSRYGGAR